MLQILNYLNGGLTPPLAGRYLDTIEPATGQVYGQIPDSGPEDVAAAVTAAEAALPAWRALPAEDRGRILVRIADLIDANLDRLARAESQDNGKPLSLARAMDIPCAASNFHFFGTAVGHFATEAHVQEGGAKLHRAPSGRRGGLHLALEPAALPLYLEDCTRFGRGLLRGD